LGVDFDVLSVRNVAVVTGKCVG
jgi:hypothetical protein